MSGTPATLTFRLSVPTTASPAVVYHHLADLGSHLVWAGERAPRKSFRLLTIEAQSRAATVGERFSSSGANSNGTFYDRSVVVEADPGARLGFDTESTLDRKHGTTWHARFAHRYTIERSGEGAVVAYAAEVRPQNYVPYWLKPGMRRVTRVMVQSMMRRNLRNLVAMAEASEG